MILQICYQSLRGNNVLSKVLKSFSDHNKQFQEIYDENIEQSHQRGFKLKTVYIGEKKNDFEARQMFQVQATDTLNIGVNGLQDFQKVLFVLEEKLDAESESSSTFVNVNDFLMNASKRKHVFVKKLERNAVDKVHNFIIDYVTVSGAFFYMNQTVEKDLFMSTMEKIRWYLDGQQNKFINASGVTALPESLFTETFRSTYHQGQLKKSLPNLKIDELVEYALKIESLLTKHFINKNQWVKVKEDLTQLSKSVHEYIQHLNESISSAKTTAYESTVDACYVIEGSLATTNLKKMKYSSLEKALLAEEFYSPLNIKSFSPHLCSQRYLYIKELELPFSVQIYKTRRPFAVFIWKVPSDDSLRTAIGVANAIHLIETKLIHEIDSVNQTRLLKEYKNVVTWNDKDSENVIELINEDTIDEESETTSKELKRIEIQALKEMINVEGLTVEDAIKQINDAKCDIQNKFSNFWEAAQKLLDDGLTIPHERRENSTCYIAPMCVSLRDLMDKTINKMNEIHPNSENNHVPSLEYFRLQFKPRNEKANTSSKYYNRFNVRWLLQTRLLRKTHVDQHYGSKQFKYHQQMALKFSPFCTIIYKDDKSTIPIGTPDAPVTAIQRQRKVLAAGVDSRGLTAADHDIVPLHLVPSVSVLINNPNEDDGFYCGKVEVILKDAVFQPSCPFRHAAEVERRIVNETNNKIIFFGTDGGVDQNPYLLKPLLSYIALFLKRDLDAVIVCRTPPHYSVLNPCERVMSILNIGLVGVALARKELDAQDESKIKSYVTKKQWRDANHKHPEKNLPELVQKTTEPVRHLLTERFESLSYKQNKIVTSLPASPENINELTLALKKVLTDESFKKIFEGTAVSKAQALEDPLLKEFISKHVHMSHYSLSIKKCLDATCKFHDVVNTPIDTFKELHYLPVPKLKTNDKYYDFDEIYGQVPEETDRPGSKQKDATKTANKPSFQLQASKARLLTVCRECQFPRLLYTRKKLSIKETKEINSFLDNNLYVCGADVPGCYQPPSIFCNKQISLHYYQLGDKLVGFKKMCKFCLNQDNLHPAKDTLVCSDCVKKHKVKID